MNMNNKRGEKGNKALESGAWVVPLSATNFKDVQYFITAYLEQNCLYLE